MELRGWWPPLPAAGTDVGAPPLAVGRRRCYHFPPAAGAVAMPLAALAAEAVLKRKDGKRVVSVSSFAHFVFFGYFADKGSASRFFPNSPAALTLHMSRGRGAEMLALLIWRRSSVSEGREGLIHNSLDILGSMTWSFL